MDEAKILAVMGAVIRERRVTMGWSQESFADSIEMHRAQYGKIERGERNITVLTLRRIAKGLKTSVADLATLAKF